ncbi:N-methyl-L-tryptophan oxidase [Microbacterium sp. kSW2-24]|uniref:N-methyl-L-tryptophan oxidase n=1 Tax=Microbacterium galbinum TaxID=2851646 RepID=UPI001FFC2DA2|nr:N-methyl-L-tryptophan oxidase [Microbacterium galbinum]MCK2023346.1 N-methyl-L-tryptophan oxidase [Microbacterium galbinum]
MAMRSTDIVVVGLGTMGSMTLWQLATTSDQSVLGIEQYGPVHANGAYAGESRLFRVAAKEGELYVPLLQRSRELWVELERQSQREILIPCGVLSLGPRSHPDIVATRRAIDDFALPHDVLDPVNVRTRYPQFHVEDDDIGIFDPLAGGLRPEVAVHAATQQAVRAGAEVLYNTGVRGIDVRGDHVIVSTDAGEIRASKVVVTTGAWTTRLLPDLRPLLTVSTYLLTWLMPRHIEQFMPTRFPAFLRDLGDLHAFGAPSFDGYSIKFCPNRLLPDVASFEEWPTTVGREHLRWIGEQAERLFPDLIPDPVRWSLHSDSETKDKMPLIDSYEDGRITLAVGMSGYGFKFAPVYGQLVADLVTTGASDWQHDLFRIEGHLARNLRVPSRSRANDSMGPTKADEHHAQ